MIETSIFGGLVFGGLAAFLLVLAAVRRAVARRGRAAAAEPAADPLLRRLEVRLDEIEARVEAQLELQGAAGASEERLQAMAGSLVGLIRDKNAAMETALAGLDQLRARLRTLEQMGDPAEARGLFERLGERLDALQAAQAAQAAATDERIAALKAQGEAGPQAALAEQFGRLYAQKDAGLASMLARLGPVESRLGALETARAAELPARETLDALEARLEGLRGVQEAGQAALAALRAEIRAEIGGGPVAEIAARLTGLHAQKEALVETLLARLDRVEETLAARDPAAALDRFAERLEAAQAARELAEGGLRERIAALETPGENPFAEISEQLTRLYAQKDATVETVFARLAPLEARLADLEAGLAAHDPAAALDRFAGRLEAVQAAQAAAEVGLRERIAALEAPGENPFAEISEQLTRLYAQKDATVETVFARLAPLEARLAELEAGLAAHDPAAALDRFAERLEAAQATRELAEGGLRERITALETPGENPFAEISEQLTRLYAQKDATVETVFARLAPLEARLAEIEAGVAGSLPRLVALEAEDPRAALEALGQRIAALQDEAAARIAALQDTLGEAVAARPLLTIADQLSRLYAQKDEALAAFEARLVELESRPAEPDADAARAEAEAIAAQLRAAREAAEQTALFANRLALIEATLPRLTEAQADMMQALDRRTGAESRDTAEQGAGEAGRAVAPPAPDAGAADLAALQQLPRVVSLHQK